MNNYLFFIPKKFQVPDVLFLNDSPNDSRENPEMWFPGCPMKFLWKAKDTNTIQYIPSGKLT